MRNTLDRVFLLLALGALGACTDESPDLVTPGAENPTAVGTSPSQTLILSERWNIAEVEADFPGGFSFDTTEAGANATYYVAPADGGEFTYTGEVAFCRDHFKPIDLWWDSGYGLTLFHLDPPLLFVGYRAGTYRSPRGLVFRRAVYETIEPSDGVDPEGNVWRFEGRFNALCRGGELEIGPLVFGGQLLVSQNPLTPPVLVRRGSGGGGCGAGGGDQHYMESYDPYSPTPDDGGGVTTSGCGGGGGGGGAEFDPSSYSCTWDYITIEISRDGGKTWEVWWSGWAQVCEEFAA